MQRVLNRERTTTVFPGQHRVMMLPSTFARYRNYIEGNQTNNLLGNRPFFERDALDIVFRPPPRTNDLVEYTETMRRILQQTYRIDSFQNGILIMEVVVPVDETRETGRVLGGNSSIERTFQSIYELDLQNILEILEERNYLDFSVSDLQFTFRFSLRELVERNAFGMCNGRVYVGNDGEEIGFLKMGDFYPRTRRPFPALCTYDIMSKQQRAALMKNIYLRTPPHLKQHYVRGVWFYKFGDVCDGLADVVRLKEDTEENRDFFDMFKKDALPDPTSATTPLYYQVCGMMSFLYGLEECKRLNGIDTHRCEAYLASPALLYYDAVKFTYENKYDVGSGFRNADFARLIEESYPALSVFIYDYRRKPLFSYYGSQYPVPEEERRFLRGDFTMENWHNVNRYRVSIFLDLEYRHYLPFFNVESFLYLRTTALNNTENAASVKTNWRSSELACIYCFRYVDPRKQAQHQCQRLLCEHCLLSFDSYEDLFGHREGYSRRFQEACRSCQQVFFNRDCLNRHRTVCSGEYYEKCKICERLYLNTTRHKCQVRVKCNRCKQMIQEPIHVHEDHTPYRELHPCPMNRTSTSQRALKAGHSGDEDTLVATRQRSCDIWVWDTESCLETSGPGIEMITQYHQKRFGTLRTPIYRHVVNFAGAMKMVSENKYVENDDADPDTVIEAHNFDELWEAMLRVSEHRCTLWFAHNFKGYDGRLLFDFFEEKELGPKHIIRSGDKIISMSVQHPKFPQRTLTFFDSLCHIARSLASFPSMFGLDPNIVKKGYFPYTFNREENKGYRGPIPPKETFGMQNKPAVERRAFEAWHEDQVNNHIVFDLDASLRDYCMNDVLILKKGLQTYAKTMTRLSGIFPLDNPTIAGYAWAVYKQSHIPPQSIFYMDYDHEMFARRALHGGKTDVRALSATYPVPDDGHPLTVNGNHRGLRYIDIQSLYPTVQYYDVMPVGYPMTRIYSNADQENIQNWHNEAILLANDPTFVGFVECDLSCQKYHFHPLLCDFQQGKLMAHLMPLKRVVVTSMEFREAIQRGLYLCTRIWRTDRYEGSTSIFTSYIKSFLQLKMTASPFPIKNPEDNVEATAKYLADIKERYDMNLTVSDFQPNAPIRNLAKLLLNSLWGKFGQRTKLRQTEVLLSSDKSFIYYDRKMRGHHIEKSSRPYGSFGELKTYEDQYSYSNKNPAIAAFVTAHARLRLWRELDKLGDRVVYHDTDSIIYEWQPNNYNTTEGPYLGDWESETGKDLIYDFVALAPKTYAYRYYDSKTGENKEIVKCKGFRIDSIEAKEKFTLAGYRRLYQQTLSIFQQNNGEQEQPPTTKKRRLSTSIQQLNFVHLTKPFNAMVSFESEKHLSFQYQKGIVDTAFRPQQSIQHRTYPIGYTLFLNSEPSLHVIRPFKTMQDLFPAWNLFCDENYTIAATLRDQLSTENTDIGCIPPSPLIVSELNNMSQVNNLVGSQSHQSQRIPSDFDRAEEDYYTPSQLKRKQTRLMELIEHYKQQHASNNMILAMLDRLNSQWRENDEDIVSSETVKQQLDHVKQVEMQLVTLMEHYLYS